MLGPHGVLRETRDLLARLETDSVLASDHYTNYVNLEGRLPADRPRMLTALDRALARGRDDLPPLFHRAAIAGAATRRYRWSTLEALMSGEEKIAVVGLGYVGLPLAVHLSASLQGGRLRLQ